MHALPLDERTDNTNTDYRSRKRCGACGDNGWVEANYRVDTYNQRSATVEEMAPCPFCLRGHKFEYPDPKWLQDPASTKPPWGEDGYWQNNPLPEHLVEHWVNTGRPQQPLTQAQQLAAIRKLTATIVGSVDHELDPRPKPPAPLVTNETADWDETKRWGMLPSGEPAPTEGTEAA